MNLHPLFSLDPPIPLLDFCLLLLLAILLSGIVMMVKTLRAIQQYSLQKAQHIERICRKNTITMLSGMVLADVFGWFELNPVFGAILSTPIVIDIIVAADIFFLFFISWEWLSVLLARKRIRTLLASLLNASSKRRM